MAKNEAEPPIIPSDVASAKTRDKLLHLLREQAEMAELKRNAEERIKDLNQQVSELMDRLGHKSILAPNHQGDIRQFTIVRGANVTLKEDLLLQRGISPVVISECKVRTEYTYVSSREPGEKYAELADAIKRQLRGKKVA
jgi:hypothetical protein